MGHFEEQEKLDREIERCKIEYEIDAINSQIKQQKQKVLESQRAMNNARNIIEQLTQRVLDAQIKLETMQ
jgi:peptidoglycan hydrolase CwlO-like protein